MSSIFGNFESQTMNAIVAGFSFASAIAWMDVIRWIVTNLVKMNKSSGAFVVVAALLTTLLSVLVYLILKRFSRRVRMPEQHPITGATA